MTAASPPSTAHAQRHTASPETSRQCVCACVVGRREERQRPRGSFPERPRRQRVKAQAGCRRCALAQAQAQRPSAAAGVARAQRPQLERGCGRGQREREERVGRTIVQHLLSDEGAPREHNARGCEPVEECGSGGRHGGRWSGVKRGGAAGFRLWLAAAHGMAGRARRGVARWKTHAVQDASLKATLDYESEGTRRS